MRYGDVQWAEKCQDHSLSHFLVSCGSYLMISWTKTGDMLKAEEVAAVLTAFKSDLVSLTVPLTSCFSSVFLPAREEAWEAKAKVQEMIDGLSIDNRNWRGEVMPRVL